MTRLSYTAYGLLGLPLAVLGLPLFIYLPTFYSEFTTISIALVGIILLVVRITDVVSDPLIGWLSDRINSRFKRKLLIVLSAPLLMVSVWFLFHPQPTAGASWLLSWSLFAYLGWTLMLLPYHALGAELSNDYHQRSSITVMREGFVLVGTLTVISLPLFYSQEQTDALSLNAWILDQIANALLWILPIALLAMLWLVKEPHQHQKVRQQDATLRSAWQIKPFRWLISSYFFNGLANGIPATLFILFVTHVLKQPDDYPLLLACYFLSGIIMLPLGLKLSKKLGKHKTWALSMLWASAVFIWVPFLGEGDFYAFLIICLLSGMSLGIDMALPASIQADVIDVDRIQNQQERSGLFFGLWGMTTKLSLALAVGLTFPLLSLSGFDPKLENSSEAVLALAILYGLLPIPFKLLSAWLMWRFPLVQPVTNNQPGDIQGALYEKV